MLLRWETTEGLPPSAQFLIRFSDESIKSPSLVLHLERVLKKAGVDGAKFIFEVTDEFATGQVRKARGFVQSLKRLGCKTALTQFGGQANSFCTLKHLDVDFLKLEQGVTEDLDNPSARSKIHRIQEFANRANKATIATRVHGARSLALLWEIGVDYVQGNYTQSPPIELRSMKEYPRDFTKPESRFVY